MEKLQPKMVNHFFSIKFVLINYFTEKEFIKIVELLHVPLQSIYNHNQMISNNLIKENGTRINNI